MSLNAPSYLTAMTGTDNVIVGVGAGRSLKTGSRNVFRDLPALMSLTTAIWSSSAMASARFSPSRART